MERKDPYPDVGTASLPASAVAQPLSSEDRALLARVLAYLEDDGSITDQERHHLVQDVQSRYEEALGLCTDDELSPEELDAQSRGSW